MLARLTSIRLDTKLADEAAEALGVKTRTDAIHTALREVVALKRFRRVVTANAGKLPFPGLISGASPTEAAQELRRVASWLDKIAREVNDGL